ncbi:MAG: diadenylate cyclase CdaA [Clostridia bacterium]|nr:diadenylate cyclase CdaA [Clostridia bacterium]
MSQLWQQISNMAWNIIHRPTLSDVLDVLLVSFLIYQLLKFTRGTRVSQVLKGLGILLLSTWITEVFRLRTINWILRWLVNAGAVLVVVLFQPELRRILEEIGRTPLLKKMRAAEEDAGDKIIAAELTQALLNMAKRKVGALVVIEQGSPLKEIWDTGTRVDGRVSQPLIENIFEPNTPLHDGAVIVRGDRVEAAGCVLPLSEGAGISRELGMRHRAALGVSEASDAVALIVSEETGIISMARGGKLTRHMDERTLTALLQSLYNKPVKTGLLATIMTLRRRAGHEPTRE